jgi:uncharacterized protein (DUF1697 family)
MSQYVAFLRAINVGGHAVVKMSDLRDAFAAAGCKGVRTYIQSGNVIFDSWAGDQAAILQRVRVKLRNLFGTEPDILFRTVREIESIVRRTPFKDFAAEPDIKLYVAFLSLAVLGLLTLLSRGSKLRLRPRELKALDQRLTAFLEDLLAPLGRKERRPGARV